ncbi:MAG: acyltransferase family protein [Myxococcales bacterium]|jgi:fucose 4-O-acetylase-like acetyltransferase|nr:acyltransferase family protein [Myxococcales bacterium]
MKRSAPASTSHAASGSLRTRALRRRTRGSRRRDERRDDLRRAAPMTERIRLVDVAKGISIVLVAFGHSHLVAMSPVARDLNRSLGLIRMPFFFLMSGLFFRAAKPLATVVHEKSASLLKPYFVTLGCVVLARVLVTGASLPAEVARVLYGVGSTLDIPWAPLWYLANLWLVFLYAHVLVRIATLARLPTWSRALLLTAQTALGLFSLHLFRDLPFRFEGMSVPLDGLPFSVDLVGISSTYFLLGYAVRERVIRFRPNVVLGAALLVVFLALDVVFLPRLDLNLRIVVSPFAVAACSLSGIYLALTVAHVLSTSERLAKMIAFFGFNSLFVLVFHEVFDEGWRRLLSFLLSTQPGLGIAGTSWLMAVLCAAAMGVVIRRLPLLAALYLPRKALFPSTPGSRPFRVSLPTADPL